MEIIEEKESQPADSQNEVDSMKMMTMEVEHRSQFPNQMN
jgi:hypothetical protein